MVIGGGREREAELAVPGGAVEMLLHRARRLHQCPPLPRFLPAARTNPHGQRLKTSLMLRQISFCVVCSHCDVPAAVTLKRIEEGQIAVGVDSADATADPTCPL